MSSNTALRAGVQAGSLFQAGQVSSHENREQYSNGHKSQTQKNNV